MQLLPAATLVAYKMRPCFAPVNVPKMRAAWKRRNISPPMQKTTVCRVAHLSPCVRGVAGYFFCVFSP